jgi:hypothetical protein
METRRFLCSMALLGMIGYGGCTDGNAPTEPGGRLDLSGAWAGSITHYGAPVCAQEGITVTLSQDRATLIGTFQTSCRGLLELRGSLDGDSLTGTLYLASNGSSIGRMSGTASRTNVRLTTWGPQTREGDGPPSRTVINVIDLGR